MADVQIQLGEKTETLRCTLAAAKKINALGGSFAVLNKIGSFDLDAYIFVVAAGLNKRPADVEDSVFATGMPSLSEKLSEYVTLLSNGGRPLKPAAEGEQQQGEG